MRGASRIAFTSSRQIAAFGLVAATLFYAAFLRVDLIGRVATIGLVAGLDMFLSSGVQPVTTISEPGFLRMLS